MKHLKRLAMIVAVMVAAVFTFTTCSDDDNTVPVGVSLEAIEFEATGGTKSVTVSGDWDAEPVTAVTWLTFTNKSATGFNVTATANTGIERAATITVGNKSIAVTQKGAVTMNLDLFSLEFAGSGSAAQTVTVTTNATDWTVTANNSWITATKSATGFNVTVADNTGDERTGTVTITATGYTGSMSVSVTQKEAVTLTVDPTSLEFAGSGSAAQTVTVTTNATDWAVTANDSWITATKGSTGFSVTVADNTGDERTGTVTVTATGYTGSMSVSVTQRMVSDVPSYEELLGSWTLSCTICYNTSDGVEHRDPYSGAATLYETTISGYDYPTYIMMSDDEDIIVPLRYDNGSLVIDDIWTIDEYGTIDDVTYYVWLFLGNWDAFDAAGFYVDGAQYVATPESGTYAFADNGTWSGYTVDGFFYYVIDADFTTMLGYLAFYKDIVLTRTTQAGVNSHNSNREIKLLSKPSVNRSSSVWKNKSIPKPVTIPLR